MPIMAKWWHSRRQQATKSHSTQSVSDPQSPRDDKLSPQEFAVLAHLAGVPGGVQPAACARALHLDTTQVSDVLTGLSARGFTTPGQDADAAVITDLGRRAFTYAQAPCCTRITR
jgi:DNA-binding MarR family transcriptional regulator